jgi:hypothetical protein
VHAPNVVDHMGCVRLLNININIITSLAVLPLIITLCLLKAAVALTALDRQALAVIRHILTTPYFLYNYSFCD